MIKPPTHPSLQKRLKNSTPENVARPQEHIVSLDLKRAKKNPQNRGF